MVKFERPVSILDREDGGSNPPQVKTEGNGSISVKTEQNERVGKIIALSHSSTSTSADDGDFCRRLS
jgi:hypothetical protein